MNSKDSIQQRIFKTAGHSRITNEETNVGPSIQKEIEKLISPLLWDRNTDEKYYLQLLEKEKRTSAEEKELQSLYIKILNFNNWHTVVKHFGVKYAVEQMLTENVIRGLFPRPLRKKYEFVRNVLSEAL
ncbi:MAG: hypothetical protein EA359_00030 [Balneolaceae bacterium]|nr:MAG: hypothetical protein EA359_00030 [Balneolaceae bacterium]